MRKTLKTLFAIVNPTDRATGASHLPRPEATQSIIATAALTDLLNTTASKAADVAKALPQKQNTPNTTRIWTHEKSSSENNLFKKLMKK